MINKKSNNQRKPLYPSMPESWKNHQQRIRRERAQKEDARNRQMLTMVLIITAAVMLLQLWGVM